jgi:pilus assembly protein CpaE
MPRSHWRLVLNRADAKVGLAPAEVEKTLGMPITTAVPSSREVPVCINRGVLIVREEPRHGVSVSLKALARECLEATRDAAAGQPVQEPATAELAPKRGLLRRKAKVS